MLRTTQLVSLQPHAPWVRVADVQRDREAAYRWVPAEVFDGAQSPPKIDEHFPRVQGLTLHSEVGAKPLRVAPIRRMSGSPNSKSSVASKAARTA
jgi:hypothetical protein